MGELPHSAHPSRAPGGLGGPRTVGLPGWRGRGLAPGVGSVEKDMEGG